MNQGPEQSTWLIEASGEHIPQLWNDGCKLVSNTRFHVLPGKEVNVVDDATHVVLQNFLRVGTNELEELHHWVLLQECSIVLMKLDLDVVIARGMKGCQLLTVGLYLTLRQA